MGNGSLQRVRMLLFGYGIRVLGITILTCGAPWIATACWDGTARILRVSDDVGGDPNRYPSLHAIAISADDRWLAASGEKRTELRQLPTGKVAYSLEGGDEVIAIDPRGTWFAISVYGSIKVLPLRQGAKPLTLTQSAASVRTLATATDGSWLAAAGGMLHGNYVIRVWDTRTGKIRKTFQGHTDRIAELRWIPGTTLIASAGMDETVRIWDLNGVQDSVTLSGHKAWVTALAVSPDATWLASGSDDDTIRVWNVSDYSLRTVLSGHSDHVRELASSPDGTWLASGSFDDTVRIWDSSSGETQKVLRGHSEWIQSIAISPDGQWVATSGWDNTLRVWNVNTGSCDASFRSEGLIRDCSWLSDGRTLAAAGTSGLYLWSYLAPKRKKPSTT
jgi:WD40 repeat protein